MEVLIGVLDDFFVPYLWITGVFVVIRVLVIPYGAMLRILRDTGVFESGEDEEWVKKTSFQFSKITILCFLKAILQSPFWPLIVIYKSLKFIFK